MPRISYVNGRYLPHATAAVHIEDRGFQFADGIYEVIALVNGHYADERGHIDRLERSLSEIGMSLPVSRRSLGLVMRELVRRNRVSSGLIYIQITRGTAPRNFPFPKNITPTFVMTVMPASFGADHKMHKGHKAVSTPDIRWKRRDIKTVALVAQVLARQKAVEQGAFEAWLIDEEDGTVTEGAASNAWIVTAAGEMITRPTAQNKILKGVTRNAIQALCARENIRLTERAFTLAEAYQAKEAFVTGAGALIAPIVELDGKKIGDGTIGSVTRKIQDLYLRHVATGGDREDFPWNPQ